MADGLITPAADTTPNIVVSDDAGYDFNAIKDISQAEAKAEAAKEDDGTSDTPGDNEVHAEETDGRSKTSKEVLDGDSDDGQDGPDELGEEVQVGDGGDGEEAKPGYLEAKAGDKTYKIPKDAKVSVKVNGKLVDMTVKDLADKASGAVNIEQQSSRLGRERKALETERSAFMRKADVVNRNAQMLSEAKDAREFCEIYARLKKEDPEVVYKNMIEMTIASLEREEKMTPEERRLEKENREYKAREKAQNIQRERSESTTRMAQEKEQVFSELKEAGLTHDDFVDALEEMRERIDSKQSLGPEFDNLETITPFDVIDYAAKSSFNRRVSAAIEGVSPKLMENNDFVTKVAKAIYKTEAALGTMTVKEAQETVRLAAERLGNKIGESLSKKAESAERSLKTSSKNANSQRQETDEDEVVDLYSHQARLRRR